MQFEIFMFGVVIFVGVVNMTCVLLDDIFESHIIDPEKIDSQIYLWVMVYLIFAYHASEMLRCEHSIRLIVSIGLVFVGTLVFSTTDSLTLYIGITLPVIIMNLTIETKLVSLVFLASYIFALNGKSLSESQSSYDDEHNTECYNN